ncbi:MAG: hypothetical protein U0234_25035 [Sandaracinus sp.]
MAIDDQGNIYVAGALEQPIALGGPSFSPAGADWFVASYDSLGHHRWSHVYGGPGLDGVWSMSVGSGVVSLTGLIHGHADFGSVSYDLPTSGTNQVLLSLDANTGAERWSRHLAGTARGEIAIDDLGHVFLLTVADGVVDLGRGPIGVSGDTRLVFASFGVDGVTRWARAGGVPEGHAASLYYNMAPPVVRGVDVVFAMTTTLDPADWGGGSPVAGGPVVLVTYGTDTGAYRSALRLGSTVGTYVRSAAPHGVETMIAGYQTANDIASSAGASQYVANVGESLLSARSATYEIQRLAAQSDGRLIVGGRTGSIAHFGGSVLDGSTSFVGVLDGEGNPLMARAIPGGGGLPTCVAVRDNVVVVALEINASTDVGAGRCDGSILVAAFQL